MLNCPKCFWPDLDPATSRPYSTALSENDNWNVTQEHEY